MVTLEGTALTSFVTSWGTTLAKPRGWGVPTHCSPQGCDHTWIHQLSRVPCGAPTLQCIPGGIQVWENRGSRGNWGHRDTGPLPSRAWGDSRASTNPVPLPCPLLLPSTHGCPSGVPASPWGHNPGCQEPPRPPLAQHKWTQLGSGWAAREAEAERSCLCTFPSSTGDRSW